MAHKRILIVDDNASFLHLLEDSIGLFCTDCQVESATDGRAALKKLARQPFDLILTDYEMPGMNGLELASVVRHTLPHTPIILMTGCKDGGALQDGILALGLEGYLQKPFDLSQIRDLLMGVAAGMA